MNLRSPLGGKVFMNMNTEDRTNVLEFILCVSPGLGYTAHVM